MVKNKIMMSLVASLALQSSVFSADFISDVVVTAKSNQTIEDTAGSVSIITAQDIKSMNATSIQEVLEEVVGINVGVNDSSIAGRQTISIRGTDSKHSLILVDGKKISGTDAQIGHSDFQYNWLPLNAIKRIEVIRGPMSALYGSRAIGGVVNIITKKPNKKISGDIDIKKGWSSSKGGDESDISLTVGGKINKNFSFAAFIQKNGIDLTKNKDDSTITDREGKDITNKMLSLWYDIDDTQQLNVSIMDGEETRETIDYEKYYDIEKSHKSIGYKKNFDDITMDLKYYITSSDSHTQQFEYTHELEDEVASAEFSIDKFDKNFLVLGFEKSTEKYRKHYDDAADDITKGFKGEIDNISAFIQDEIELNNKTLLVLGGRYDKHEKFGGNFSPKTNIVYKLDSNSKLKAGYGEGFNAPTVTQNSSTYRFAGRHIFIGNDNLKPETSKSFEFGYENIIDTQTFKFTLFKTDIKNLIDGKFISSAPFGPPHLGMVRNTYQYSNVNKVSTKGVELEYDKKQLFANVDFKFGYNYLKTKDEKTNKELIAKPKHKINMAFKAKLPHGINSIARVRYTGSQYGYDASGNREKKSGYTIVGLQLSKELVKNFTARIGVENLTNKQLDDKANYQIKGRLAYVGLNYKF